MERTPSISLKNMLFEVLCTKKHVTILLDGMVWKKNKIKK
jgi:hypothetical protein